MSGDIVRWDWLKDWIIDSGWQVDCRGWSVHLDEGVVGVLVDSECLVQLLGPSSSVCQTGLLFLAIGGV